MQKMTVNELFSGIGAQKRGLDLTGVFDCEVKSTSDINKEAMLSYAAVHCGLTEKLANTYQHYPSKKALFDAIVEASSNGYEERMKRINEAIFNSGNSERPFTEEGQIEIMKNLFITTVSDEYPKLFREFVLSVHSKHPELAKIYNSRYIFSQYELYQKVILKLIEMGVLVDNDAEMMAIEYVSPVTLWVEACSREPERKEEFLSLLEKHIRHFFNVYGKK